MAITKTDTIGDIEVTVRELTVVEIREWLGDVDRYLARADVVDMNLFDDVPTIQDVLMMSSLSGDQVDKMAPSDLDRVRAMAKEANPYFFAMLARIAQSAPAAVA